MKNSEIGKKLTDNEEKCEEQLLFPKEKWDSLIKWQPVSNIPVEEIYKDLPEVKRYHDNYVRFWLKDKGR
jgi:hypothetical protein